MSKQIILANPGYKRQVQDPILGDNKHLILNVAEFFSETIQGEGVSAGVPAAFMRLQGCTLDCVWCDTAEVWRIGNPYSFNELFILMEEAGLIEQLRKGTHLVITGGSPLKQQTQLVVFISQFIVRYGFKPYIEVENECVLMPIPELQDVVDQWNNSPKLSNSGMKERARIKPYVLQNLSLKDNSWFKFVVEKESDWSEIEKDFLQSNLIHREQIILMPCGQTQAELSKTRELTADIAIREGVRFSDRLHITLWDKKTGV